MKIIKHGKLKANQYSATCHNCRCIMLYNANDVHFLRDDHSDAGFIYCPECGTRISATGYNIDNEVSTD